MSVGIGRRCLHRRRLETTIRIGEPSVRGRQWRARETKTREALRTHQASSDALDLDLESEVDVGASLTSSDPQFSLGISRKRTFTWSFGIPSDSRLETIARYNARFASSERPAKASMLMCV